MGDSYDKVCNISRHASAAWRDNSLGAFSHSACQEDDEESLRQAALEKLSKFGCLRKGLSLGCNSTIKQVDGQNLGFEKRKKLLGRLVNEQGKEKFLLKLKNRFDVAGIDLPTVEVRFENLKVETEAHVGSRALPSFTNFFMNIFEEFATFLRLVPSQKKHISILRNISGILKPCRLTLLLGPPSSGKTTLLLALSGKLNSALKFSGTVTYNGHAMDEFVPQRTAAYISQSDSHIGEMTVRETLAFAARCQGVGSGNEMLEELLRREKEANIIPDHDVDAYMQEAAIEGQEANIVTDYIIKILGLDICADTLVGDQLVRGISGGQKKRVTAGEMLVGPAKVFFMDEISNGLDSSTTFQVVNSIRDYTRILEGTTIISLLQPEPETYNLFDDIILMSDGQIIYQGPRENVLEFFEFMGFSCPDRKGVADFLQEVMVEKDQQQYWVRNDIPYRFITVHEFSEASRTFHVGKRLITELATPFDKNKSHPAALSNKAFGISKKDLLKVCLSREVLLTKRNSFVYIFKLIQFTVMAIIATTLFFRPTMHKNNVVDGWRFMGSMFYAITTATFNGMLEIPLIITKLPIFYKHRDMFLYPAWAYAVPKILIKILTVALEMAAFVLLTYYEIGYDPNVGRFFKHYLVLFLELQVTSCLFRMIAAIGRNMVTAMTMSYLLLILLISLNGYSLARDYVKKWWIWFYWCSPTTHATNAIFVNEFMGKSWSHVLANTNESLGVEVLKSRQYVTGEYWYWIGVGTMSGLILLFNLGFILALTFLGPLQKHQAMVQDDSSRNHINNYANGSVPGVDKDDQTKKKGMVLPYEPHYIAFEGIKYSVNMPQEMKEQGSTEDKLVLLKGVTGAFRPGILTALMGVSGAGKTTLMDVLSGRKTGGYIDGTITISGYPKKQETFTRISGYCEQNDIHSPSVTVYESLLFSAWLRLPSDIDFRTRKMFVEKVMELVELTSLSEGIVGLPGISGLSTEQRKRLTIAVELVANPSIIFMDEPTSGLDARAAAIVMRAVKNTVDTGRTVVCTIHQPSIDIFESFDELFMMKQGGEEIYVGPLGQNSCHLIQYFEGIEGIPKINDGYNPATWMLEITSHDQETLLGIDFAEVYKTSDLYRQNKALVRELSLPGSGTSELHFPTRYSQPFFIQFLACLWRQHWSYWRNTSHSAVRILYTILLAIIMGSVFWGLGSSKDTKVDVMNAMGSMYVSVFLLGNHTSASVQPVLSVERPVFYRERGARMYSAFPYALSQALIEIPYVIIQSIIYGTIVYAMIGYEWTATKYLWYTFVFFSSQLFFIYFGMATVVISPNDYIANIIASGFYTTWNLFSGFMVPRPITPVWWRWYHWANPVAWTLYGAVVSQFGDVTNEMEDTKQSVQYFLESYFGFRHDFMGIVGSALVGFALLCALSYAFCTKFLNYQRR